MKPLPLLITLFAVALLAAFLLISRTAKNGPDPSPSNGGALTPIPSAPLPIDYVEPELPVLQPPLLEGDLTPSHELISFVEKFLGLTFTQPPVFAPVPAEEVITSIEEGLSGFYSPEQVKELNLLSQRLGVLPTFQQIDQTVITILAGEIRGLITPTRNLILHDFQETSPPEQAALVNLLAQRLLSQSLPFSEKGDSIDQVLARHFTIQTLALATEREFRKTLPQYPPSLNENLRQSILLGLPSFFHELSTFAEFHLLEKSKSSTPTEAVAFLTQKSSTPSRQLLAFPFKPEPSSQPSTLGAIPLYLILLEATDPTTARTLATSLAGDRVQFEDNTFTWTLTFASPKNVPRCAEFFRSYYSLRDAERKVTLEVADTQLIIKSAE